MSQGPLHCIDLLFNALLICAIWRLNHSYHFIINLMRFHASLSVLLWSSDGKTESNMFLRSLHEVALYSTCSRSRTMVHLAIQCVLSHKVLWKKYQGDNFPDMYHQCCLLSSPPYPPRPPSSPPAAAAPPGPRRRCGSSSPTAPVSGTTRGPSRSSSPRRGPGRPRPC